MPDNKNVSLHPSAFSDDLGLLDASMEEVVALFLEKEKRRHREAKEDENQMEVMVRLSHRPERATLGSRL